MEHLENDDPNYKAYRNLEAEASQSTSKNAPSSQIRKGLKLFAQTCDRFQISDRAAAALSSALLLTLKLLPQKRRNCSLIKTKSGVSVPNKALQSSDCALASQSIQGLYFDSQKETTLIQVTEQDGRLHQRAIREEHISIVSELNQDTEVMLLQAAARQRTLPWKS